MIIASNPTAAIPMAKPSRGGGISEQDGAHRLGGDATAGELPAHGNGGLGCQAKLWSLRESNDA